ncbi:MAG: hypothetical protein R3B09_10830 [Nannocystaceae bacterium]
MRAPPDLGAAAADPAASAGVDPSALTGGLSNGVDPSALGVDPSALGVDPSALGVDPSALSGIDPSALGFDPSALSSLDPMQALDPALGAILGQDSARIAILAAVAGLVLFLVRLLRAKMKPGERAPGPSWVAAALILIGVYLFARLVDPLLATLLDRPHWIAAERWARIGWFEWKLLGRPGIAAALPLADHPGLALLVHLPLWGALLFLVSGALRFFYDVGSLTWETRTDALPWFYRWAGSSTVRRADRRFRRWVLPLLFFLLPIHVLAGLGLEIDGGGPAPGTWVVAGLLLWTTLFHLATDGKKPPPKPAAADEETSGQVPEDMSREQGPLARLRAAIAELRPGVVWGAHAERPAAPGVRAELPAALAPLVREVFEDLCGDARPWAHQAEVLAHVAGVFTLTATAAADDGVTLDEVRARSPIGSHGDETPHALLVGGEGSGRTTVTLLAALHVFLDRGATTLVVVRSRAAARAWAARLGDALARSSARWNVQVAIAGEDLAAPLLAGRTPAIVVADLEAFEAEVLCNRRTDELLARLGLLVVDDVDAFHGVAEMHLQVTVRRLWALLETLHAASFPVVLLATVGAGARGVDTWARHVLAQPLRVFADDRAPTRRRIVLRRQDLVDQGGQDLPLAQVIEAAELAELPWHLRLAGDPTRAIARADFELGGSRVHYKDEPAEAALVILEGTYPEVRVEADRLCHAGWRGSSREVILILAPPADEETVLHDEAEDAPQRALVDALPHPVPLSEPRVIRQRHLDRALGREQDLAGLRERLGARFVDEATEALARDGRIRKRQALHLDVRTDEIAERTLVRADHEVALGQAIDAECVTEAAGAVSLVDAGTAEVLLRIDAAIAGAIYPPGRIFLHPRGRYRVLDQSAHGPGTVAAERIAQLLRTTPERRLTVDLPADLELSDRQLGGLPLAVALCSARVREEVVGVRVLGPGPVLLERRAYDRPSVATYGTDLCLLRARLGDGEHTLTGEAAAPLVAAIRMMLPCALRASNELVDVDAVALDGGVALCLFDRTIGASGFTYHLAERTLADLLTLARMALTRLARPELARLWHIHDTRPGADPSRWDIDGALRWLAAILDPVRRADAAAVDARPLGPRVEHARGASPGDLGRLWVSASGRSDDLAWTRHRFWPPSPLPGQPEGEQSLEVAAPRSLLARARGSIDDPEVAATLELLRSGLQGVFGPHHVDVVLALCAAIPLAARPLAADERSPLCVLLRRRADLEAKLALALALLPPGAAEVVRGGPVPGLRVKVEGGGVPLDLRGPALRSLPAAGSAPTT